MYTRLLHEIDAPFHDLPTLPAGVPFAALPVATEALSLARLALRGVERLTALRTLQLPAGDLDAGLPAGATAPSGDSLTRCTAWPDSRGPHSQPRPRPGGEGPEGESMSRALRSWSALGKAFQRWEPVLSISSDSSAPEAGAGLGVGADACVA